MNPYFGHWCPYKPQDLFCQEEGGCSGCAIAQGQEALDRSLASVKRCGRTTVEEEDGEYD